MDCNKIRELLLTDYVDNELTRSLNADVDSHLAACPQCAEFLKKVKSAATAPFEHAPRATPPPEIWNRIQSSLGTTAPAHLPRRHWLSATHRIRMVAFSLSAAAMLLVSFLYFSDRRDSVVSDPVLVAAASYDWQADIEGNGFGTAVEEYLLN
ncbi:MAG: hypothetical protein A2219_03660 [Elusimicrobia bacterium RIFOXYA2_FULL_50_26]|nr:MAG: hypothetical protein A2219_03660 [Elusimicrobia bacterium RIFOXYA2_FULL_50_26]OGS22438.1 MAG: hypothetical protein A2314_07725 [Elusimicrobia bacterium RIFOXYB2_FULL_50_12]